MKIGIVNDLELAVEALRRAVLSSNRHSVAWIATNGEEAIRLAKDDPADVILMDLVMPRVDGVEATRRIMKESPCPILVVTATVHGHAEKVFQALSNGAIDAVPTPILTHGNQLAAGDQLLAKLDELGEMQADRRSVTTPHITPPFSSDSPRWLVAIGASAGGPAALGRVLSDLPPEPSAAFVIVQHVDAHFAPTMACWLNERSGVPVRLASEGSVLVNGLVLFSGGDRHLVFRSPNTLGYSAEPRHLPYRPSVDVFFQSILKHWKGQIIAVLLTGMGRDGAAGLKALRTAGAMTIAQDESTSMVYGMPKAAAELDAAVSILPLEKIGAAIRSCLARGGVKSSETER